VHTLIIKQQKTSVRQQEIGSIQNEAINTGTELIPCVQKEEKKKDVSFY